jgi:hypothetical protein
MRLIYPSEPFSPSKVEEAYEPEATAAREAGFPVSLVDLDGLKEGQLRPKLPLEDGEPVLYRGWMLNSEEYESFFQQLVARGVAPVTAPKDYLLCHHLPNWYEQVREFTAETLFFSESADIPASLTALGWDGCFLKDHVKSLSTAGGSLIRDLSGIPSVIANMRKYRGEIEGGLCARRIEQYEEGSEKRYFVYRGVACSDDGDVPEMVNEVARRIGSRFYSVDVALRSDGILRIIELGDGQVSDRKHWSTEAFLNMLKAAG